MILGIMRAKSMLSRNQIRRLNLLTCLLYFPITVIAAIAAVCCQYKASKCIFNWTSGLCTIDSIFILLESLLEKDPLEF